MGKRGVVLAVVAALLTPAAVHAALPQLRPLSLLPALPGPVTAEGFAECPDGSPACVDATIAEMHERLDALGCDHNALFLQAYLITTEYYRDMAGEFADPRYLAREDAVFAGLYFKAYDTWKAGGPVPKAWKIAFDASASRAVSGFGDLLLAGNAHINRDMPFMLAGLGLRFPDGSSRKPDHHKAEDFLATAAADAPPAVAARYDPSVDDTDLPGSFDSDTLLAIASAQREVAWRHAELLLAAPTAAGRALVADYIERYAEAQALAIRAATAYLPPLLTSATRDAFCAAHL